MRVTFAPFCLLLGSLPLLAQNGMVAGKVVDSEKGEPLRKASLELRPDPPGAAKPLAARSDEEGAFLFPDVPPGRYSLDAAKPGYVSNAPGGRMRGRRGALLDVAEGQKVDDVVLRLTPGGVVTGRVLDEFRDPMPGARVEILRYAYLRDKRELLPHGGGQTDDRGEFRIWGLQPGRYYVRAQNQDRHVFGDSPAPDVAESLIPTFFPSAAEAPQAAMIEVRAGAETPGIDIQMLLDRTFRVSGVVLDGETRRPVGPAMVMMAPSDGRSWIGAGPRDMVRDSSGQFTLSEVRPGAYRIHAILANSGQDRRSGAIEVVVADRDVSGIVVELQPTVEVNAQVLVEGGSPRPEGQLFVSLRSDMPGPLGGGGGMADVDGKVVVSNVSPGEYTVMVNGELGDYFLRAVRFGDQLLEDGKITIAAGKQPELELLLSPNGGRIAGLVTHGRNEALPGATVVLLREDRDDRFTKTAQTDQNGAYLMRGVAPGHYQLFAWEEIEPMAWRDPDFLRSFEEDAKKVEARESDALEVSLEALDQPER